MIPNTNDHPCFNEEARKRAGRVHLPVAPDCNIQCRYCNRKYDCVNESRPGVTSGVLKPRGAVRWLSDVLTTRSEIRVVGIAGPGDPFANAPETMETLRLVRNEYPNMLLCVATNGLAIGPHIDELGALSVSHVTLTMNAVDPDIGKELYRWMRDGTRVLRGKDAARRLLDRQLLAIARLKRYDIIVKINAIIVPGVNDEHIEEVAKTAAAYGVDMLNCMPLYPAPDSDFETIAEPDAGLIHRVRSLAGKHIPLMSHCSRCRADAVGFLGDTLSGSDRESLQKYSVGFPSDERPYVAAATQEGYLINEHLGRATEFLIYRAGVRGAECIERRTAPAPGGGDARWDELADRLSDCFALVASVAGPRPQRLLEERGIHVHIGSGLITDALESLFSGKPLPSHIAAAAPEKCKMGCGGNGGGCGA
ncbi:MAG: radical SAM protein [Chitinivibrionales bacterium]|nr:radical SAM protein [Chitinivibrionales bacterium]MBD3356689.1 radical SAM protein [Chitinivibrionales bacterium]